MISRLREYRWFLLMSIVLVGAVCLFIGTPCEAADANVVIPWQGGTAFSTNINFYVSNLGESKTLSVTPASGYCFKGPVSAMVTAGGSSTTVNPPSVTHRMQADFTITLVGPDKQGTVQVSGKIEPCGAGGGAPVDQAFNISVLDRLAWIRYSSPNVIGGTNLIACAGTTNNVEATVTLGDMTAPSSGQVSFGISPSTLGSYVTTGNVALTMGKASNKLVLSTAGGSGFMTATASQLKDASNNPVAGLMVSTNAAVVAVKVEITAPGGGTLSNTGVGDNLIETLARSVRRLTITTVPATPGLSLKVRIDSATPDTPDKGKLIEFLSQTQIDTPEDLDNGNYRMRYQAKQETANDKCANDPELQDQVIVLKVFCQEQEQDSLTLMVKSRFNFLIDIGRRQQVVDYINRKYNIGVSNPRFSPGLSQEGLTVGIFFAQVLIGPRALDSENLLASTLFHEQTHVNQSPTTRVNAGRGKTILEVWNASGRSFALSNRQKALIFTYAQSEIDAFNEELAKASFTCLSPQELQDVVDAINEFTQVLVDIGC